MPAKLKQFKFRLFQKNYDNLVYFLSAGITVFVLVLTVLIFKGLTVNVSPPEVLAQEINYNPNRDFWVNFLAANPNYFPGWIELANIEEKLNNQEDAKAALKTAKDILPNSEMVKDLENGAE